MFSIKNKTTFLVSGFVSIVAIWFISGYQEALAATKTTWELAFKNQSGSYLSGISYTIYEQELDINNKPKPGKQLVTGKIDPLLLKATTEFTSEKTTFVVKVWDEKNTSDQNGVFWFYNNTPSGRFEKTLSALRFIVRKTDNTLVKNTKINLYYQRKDADNKPIRETTDKISVLDTSAEGEATIYLATGAQSLDGNGSGYYTAEIPASSGVNFLLYDILVLDQTTRTIDYKLSELKISLSDGSGLIMANYSVELYKQVTDVAGKNTLGDKIATLKTDNSGSVTYQYPAGSYAAKVKKSDNQYETFWYINISDQSKSNYDLKIGSTSTTGNTSTTIKTTCDTASELKLIIRDLNGNYITGMNYELYQQITDVNGRETEGLKVGGGKVDDNGLASVKFNPESGRKYALKIFDKNKEAGAFWYWGAVQFACNENKEIARYLPFLKVILRNGDGSLRKNQKFSIYAQKTDADGHKIADKNYLVANLDTGETGASTLYLAPNGLTAKEYDGNYIMQLEGENKSLYIKYDVKIDSFRNNVLEYTISDLLLDVKDIYGRPIQNAKLDLYERKKNLGNQDELGTKLGNFVSDSSGRIQIELADGRYALSFKDDLGQSYIFWDIKVTGEKRNYQTVTSNLVKFKLIKPEGSIIKKDEKIAVYSMVKSDDGGWFENKKIKDIKINANGLAESVISPGPYLFKYSYQNKSTNKLVEYIDYGQATWIEDSKKREIDIKVSSEYIIRAGQRFVIPEPKKENKGEKLKGYILLQTQSKGEAWYVNPADSKRYYLKNGEVAYQAMRKMGYGITSKNLNKIPIGFISNNKDLDSDADGLPDKMEEALGTQINNKDTDGDTYPDGTEILNGYNPLGAGKLNLDQKLANQQKGKILLQVEDRGQAWYINPKDGKRYYMKDGPAAYEIMRYLSLGINNDNIEGIEEGQM